MFSNGLAIFHHHPVRYTTHTAPKLVGCHQNRRTTLGVAIEQPRQNVGRMLVKAGKWLI